MPAGMEQSSRDEDFGEIPAEGEAPAAPTFKMEGPVDDWVKRMEEIGKQHMEEVSNLSEDAKAIDVDVTAPLSPSTMAVLEELNKIEIMSDSDGYLTPDDTVLTQDGMSDQDRWWEMGVATPTKEEEELLLGD